MSVGRIERHLEFECRKIKCPVGHTRDDLNTTCSFTCNFSGSGTGCTNPFLYRRESTPLYTFMHFSDVGLHYGIHKLVADLHCGDRVSVLSRFAAGILNTAEKITTHNALVRQEMLEDTE